jgi:hypothetical protein
MHLIGGGGGNLRTLFDAASIRMLDLVCKFHLRDGEKKLFKK